MSEVAWTAIGLPAATLFGSLFWLGSRIAALGARLDGRLDGIDRPMDQMNARLDGVNARLDVHLRTRGHG